MYVVHLCHDDYCILHQICLENSSCTARYKKRDRVLIVLAVRRACLLVFTRHETLNLPVR